MKRAAGSSMLVVLGLAGAGLAGTGCAATDADWRERYLEKERDSSDTAAQLSSERSARAAAVSQLEEARAQVTALQRENDALKSRPGEAAAPAAPANDAAANESVDRLKTKGFDAYRTADGNIAIVLPADINFAAGSKDLTPAGRKAVDSLSGELDGQFAGYSIRIEGHTDGDPIKKAPFKDNWELGSERALSVLRTLVNDHKVAPERLVAASRGETVPVADNKTEKGKAKNRRVEVVVLVPHDSSMAK
jgi:chemotaxis protein MotB